MSLIQQVIKAAMDQSVLTYQQEQQIHLLLENPFDHNDADYEALEQLLDALLKDRIRRQRDLIDSEFRASLLNQLAHISSQATKNSFVEKATSPFAKI